MGIPLLESCPFVETPSVHSSLKYGKSLLEGIPSVHSIDLDFHVSCPMTSYFLLMTSYRKSRFVRMREKRLRMRKRVFAHARSCPSVFIYLIRLLDHSTNRLNRLIEQFEKDKIRPGSNPRPRVWYRALMNIAL